MAILTAKELSVGYEGSSVLSGINFEIKILPQRYNIYHHYTNVYGNMSEGLTLYDIIKDNYIYNDYIKVEFVDKSNNRTDITNEDLSTVVVVDESHGYYVFTFLHNGCLSGESLITVYDTKKKKKTKKKLKDLTYDDLVLCWDFDKGEFTYAKPLWIKKETPTVEYYQVEFDNGTSIRVIGGHRLFCVNQNKFVSIGENGLLKVGEKVYTSSGEAVTITSIELINGPETSCNVILDHHINLFVNDILTTACNFSNMYEIKDMKYVVDTNNRLDVSKLNVDPKYIEGVRLSELPKDFMKNEEETINNINKFFELRENEKK